MTYRSSHEGGANPDFAEQVKAAEGRACTNAHNRRRGQLPSKEREVGALEVLITPEEWEIVKRALVQFWASESMEGTTRRRTRIEIREADSRDQYQGAGQREPRAVRCIAR